MAHVLIFEKGSDKPSRTITESDAIGQFLSNYGVLLEQVYLQGTQPDFEAGQDEIIESCRHQVNGLMQAHGFSSLDVLALHSGIADLARIRQNCLREHSHTSDEGRLILSGQAMFCLRLSDHEFCLVLCSAGDFMLLPAGLPHWFDPGEVPRLCAVRLSDSGSDYQACHDQEFVANRPPGFDAVRNLLTRSASGSR